MFDIKNLKKYNIVFFVLFILVSIQTLNIFNNNLVKDLHAPDSIPTFNGSCLYSENEATKNLDLLGLYEPKIINESSFQFDSICWYQIIGSNYSQNEKIVNIKNLELVKSVPSATSFYLNFVVIFFTSMVLVRYQDKFIRKENKYFFLLIYICLILIYFLLNKHVVYLILISLLIVPIFPLIKLPIISLSKIPIKNSVKLKNHLNSYHFDSKYKIFSTDKKVGFLFCFVLFFISFVYQLTTLNIEILDWDIGTFLVVAGDILRGHLPYENQWEYKGPLFFFMYTIPQIFSKNLIIVKIFNDVIFSLTVLTIFFTLARYKKDYFLAFISSLGFVFLTSISSDGHPGYSEVYSLLFLGLAIYFYLFKDYKYKVFFSGFFAACSLLITVSSLLFIAYFSLIQFINSDNKVKNIINYSLGFLSPYTLIFAIYLSQNLLFEFIFTNFIVPFSYVQNNSDKIELLKGVFLHLTDDISRSLLIYFGGFVLGFISLKTLIELFYKKKVNYDVLLFTGFVFISILSFVLAGKGYWHHIMYFLYFLSFLIFLLDNTILKISYSIIILGILISTFLSAFQASYANVKNVTQDDYVIYQEYKNISNNYNIKSIYATGDHLILFYFDLPQNYYIVHPSLLYSDDYIFMMNMLSENNLVKTIDVNQIIIESHDLIICHPKYLSQLCRDLENSKNYENINSNLELEVFVRNGLEKVK